MLQPPGWLEEKPLANQVAAVKPQNFADTCHQLVDKHKLTGAC